MTTSPPTTNLRQRNLQILRLFFGLLADYLFQYLKARLTLQSYDFFADELRNRARAVRIRQVALQMGGVLIKVGQFLSSRVDVLPPEYIEELALLQDEVPGVPFDAVQSVITESFGQPAEALFRHIDQQPVAAASLGQVHRAVLPTGEVVAVKVQRPGIDAVVEADLRTFRIIVRWMNRLAPVRRRVDLPLILREFEDTLRLELDYHSEAHHAERLAVIFYENAHIVVPRIYWSHTRGRVITMQYMSGIKVSDYDTLEHEGISRGVTAEILMRAYLRQVLQVGFFHADPHPGNILVRPGPIVVFLDFGMVGFISPRMLRDIRSVFLGIVQRDYDAVLDALDRLGFIPTTADRRVLKAALVWVVNTFYEMSFAELAAVHPQEVLDRLQDVFYTESFRIPANFAFLGRALGTLSGLCTALDPSFQFVTVAEPFARGLISGGRGVRGLFETLTSEARSLAETGYRLPDLTRRALERVDEGEFEFRHDIAEVSLAVGRLEKIIRRLLFALLVSGFLVTGALTYRTHYQFIGVAAFALAVIFMILAFLPVRRRARVFPGAPTINRMR